MVVAIKSRIIPTLKFKSQRDRPDFDLEPIIFSTTLKLWGADYENFCKGALEEKNTELGGLQL